ncbi:hypothetical protein [Bacillus cereus]|uniref:hypothetical protein n=1 Tax=Bacillus cereus TaxID=1396 RepID=UPI0018CF314B|nr:hypothetical protein [Bacillus cereus]MBG9617625.1 phage protein [Bacillus cereus]
MACYSKITLLNGKEYIVPMQFDTLIEKMLVNGEGEFLNTFVLTSHIDEETGNEIQVALNPQYIVIIVETSIRIQPNIPSVFRIEKTNKDLG